MVHPIIREKLSAAILEHDKKESVKKYYNPYALGIMLKALHECENEFDKGKPIRQVLVTHFTGRLLDKLLKAAGEPKATKQEHNWF